MSEQPIHAGQDSQILELQDRLRRAENDAKDREDEILTLRSKLIKTAQSTIFQSGNSSFR